MRKKDIKNGAIIKIRDGRTYIKVDNTLLNTKMDGKFLSLNEFNNKLYNKDGYVNLDIIKVLNPRFNSIYPEAINLAIYDYFIDQDNITWDFERIEFNIVDCNNKFIFLLDNQIVKIYALNRRHADIIYKLAVKTKIVDRPYFKADITNTNIKKMYPLYLNDIVKNSNILLRPFRKHLFKRLIAEVELAELDLYIK